MKPLHRSKLFRRQLLAFLGLAFFVMATMGSLAFFRTRATILDRQVEVSGIFMTRIERHLLDWLGERKTDIRLLAQILELEKSALDPGLARPRLRAFLAQKPDFVDAFVVDAQGLVAANKLDGPLKRADLSDRDYVRAALQDRSFTSSYFRGRMLGSMVFALSEPVHSPEGRVAGAAVAIFSLDRLVAIADNVALRDLGAAILLDGEGRVISSQAFRDSRRDQDLAKEGALASLAGRQLALHQGGRGRYLNAEGLAVVGSYSWIESLGLGLILELSEAEALRPLTALLGYTVLFIAIILLILLGMAYYLSARLVAPIGALLEATSGLMAGHYSRPIGLRTGTELDRLVTLFDQMAETVMDREAQLRENAARDSLTGLYNHGRVDEFLALEMRRNRRSNGIVSFAMIDIDHFKLVNDNYGHLAGDEVLKGLARILEANVREGDLVGRFGGEEFAVILAASPPEVTRAFCERLRQLVADTVFRFEDLEMRVTVSIGWASARPTLAEAVDIIQWADQALYQAKESGRNAVRGGLASVGNPPVIG